METQLAVTIFIFAVLAIGGLVMLTKRNDAKRNESVVLKERKNFREDK